MPSTLTVTGYIGPGRTLTSKVFPNISEFTINCEHNLVSFISNGVHNEVSISGTNTCTMTAVAGVYTLTIA